jgi:hypothetical protein
MMSYSDFRMRIFPAFATLSPEKEEPNDKACNRDEERGL